MRERDKDFSRVRQPRLLDYLVTVDDQEEGSIGDALPLQVEPLQISQETFEKSVGRIKSRHAEIVAALKSPLVGTWFRDYLYTSTDDRYLEHLLFAAYEPTWLSNNTRKVFFDLETYHLPKDEEIQFLYPTGSTNYIAKQRLGIAASIDDQGVVKYWDESLVQEFIEYLISFDEIVSYNGLRFDNYVLANYSGDLQTIQQIYNKTFDFLDYFEMVTGRRIRLDTAAHKYLHERKLDKGGIFASSKSIPEILRRGSEEEKRWVWRYNFTDTHLLLRLYRKFNPGVERKIDFYEWKMTKMGEKVERVIAACLRKVTEEIDQASGGSTMASLEIPSSEYYQDISNALKEYAAQHADEVLSYLISRLHEEDDIGIRLLISGYQTQFNRRLLLFFPNPLGDQWTEMLSGAFQSALEVPAIQKFLEAKKKLKFLPPKVLEKTDFLERAYTVNPNGEFLQGVDSLILQDDDGNLYIVCKHLRKPSDKEIQLLKRAKLVFSGSLTQGAQSTIKKEELSSKFRPLSLEQLIQEGVVVEKTWPQEALFASFMHETIVPKLYALLTKFDREAAIKIQPVLIKMSDPYQPLVRGLEPFNHTSWYRELLIYFLRIKYSLFYIQYLTDPSTYLAQKEAVESLKREILRLESIGVRRPRLPFKKPPNHNHDLESIGVRRPRLPL